MAKNVTVFTTTNCAYCVMVKRFLDMKGASYDVVNMDENPERRAEVLALSGAQTAPVTIVRNDDDESTDVVIGYNPARLASVAAAVAA